MLTQAVFERLQSGIEILKQCQVHHVPRLSQQSQITKNLNLTMALWMDFKSTTEMGNIGPCGFTSSISKSCRVSLWVWKQQRMSPVMFIRVTEMLLSCKRNCALKTFAMNWEVRELRWRISMHFYHLSQRYSISMPAHARPPHSREVTCSTQVPKLVRSK